MRIAYWTTCCLAPQIEAISKEIFDLAASFPNSRILAMNPHLSLSIRRGRAIGFHPSFYPLLRAVIPLMERVSDLNHVYAEVAPWLFFRTLGRRPTVLTIASEKGDPIEGFMARCATIVTQTEGMRQRLLSLGIEPAVLRLIYPGIDLAKFTPSGDSSRRRRPSVLLATFPRETHELEGRGIWLLVEAAKRYPDIDFSLVGRPWSASNTAQPIVEREIESSGLRNMNVLHGTQAHMEDLYRSHDFTVIPYTAPGGGKECPRSLIEALACGAPVLISDRATFSSFVAAHDCGRVFQASAEGFAAALEQGLSAYPRLSANAARVARQHFDLRRTLREYGEIYDGLT